MTTGLASFLPPVSPAFIDSTSPEAARALARLLEEHSSFSFLRLGDGELRFLLQQQGSEEIEEQRPLRPSCDITFGTPGLTPEHAQRLLQAYERCSLIDLYGELAYNKEMLGTLQWQRSPKSVAVASSGGVGLLFTWLFHELRPFLARHRVVVCGAEASLLRELLEDRRYRELVEPFWPQGAAVCFSQPRNDGAQLSADLDHIKEDLRKVIQEHRAGALLLSLGGGAKILCHELAEEMNIRAIDFGSGLRALTYSGSDGHTPWRSTHHPHLVRVPLEVYLAALRRARPDLDSTSLVAKAHAQLCLEMQRKELLRSNTSDLTDLSMFDDGPENRPHFFRSLAIYRREVLPLARHTPEARELAREFRYWRWKKGLGWDGRIFRAGVAIKGALRQLRRLVLGGRSTAGQ